MDSRSSTPEPPPQDLWSSILDSVSKSRSIPSKQVLLLGQPATGKSTLASALLQKPVSEDDKRLNFALGYDFADVRDDADEDTIARLSVYRVPSAEPSYSSLLPDFLSPRTCLPHTLIMIVLDWTRPWIFVDDLEIWLRWVETWAKGDGSREVQIAKEENRERLQSHLQHYTEPSTDPLPTSSSFSSTLLPLGSGTLTHNSAGVPIIVVCTKADLIDEGHDMVAGVGMPGMVKGKGGEWEERTDGIMQVLRTVCLKYGAALFYTTQVPSTLQILRQYALHLLFAPPAPSPAMASSAEPPAPIRNPFPFQHKPNTLDRDRIVIPAGWDSWGKITVMREFDPRMWGDAWDRDVDEEGGEEMGAKKLFSALVPDQGTKPPPLPPFNNPMPEQGFLAKHYDENSKKPDRDPRAPFRNPADLDGGAAGIVGPLGSSSLSLPNVEKLLMEMEAGIGGSTGTDRRSRPTRPTPLTNATSPTNLGGSSRPPPSPNVIANSPSPVAAGQTQHEVLQNFFQSLLSNKDRPPAGSRPKANGLNSSTSGTEES